MNQPVFHVRRATVDDLEALRALWETMHFPALELERRLTEFQVAVAEDGGLLGRWACKSTGGTGCCTAKRSATLRWRTHSASFYGRGCNPW